MLLSNYVKVVIDLPAFNIDKIDVNYNLFLIIPTWEQKKHICKKLLTIYLITGLRSAVGNVSGYRCVSDCRSRGREFDPGPVPYFRGD